MNKKPLKEASLNVQELEKIHHYIRKLARPAYGEKLKIIAITKTCSYKAIEEAYKNGIRDIGENRIQELEEKIANKKLPKELNIHLVGHLQTNKAKKAVRVCDYIQSIDSLKIAKAVNTEAYKINVTQKIYLQINIGEDPNKYGFTFKEIFKASNEINQMTHLQVCGIMTILPQTSDQTHIKALYNATKRVSKRLLEKNRRCKQISMGMSNDYHIAIECGATNIRIGTRLFGKRK